MGRGVFIDKEQVAFSGADFTRIASPGPDNQVIDTIRINISGIRYGPSGRVGVVFNLERKISILKGNLSHPTGRFYKKYV